MEKKYLYIKNAVINDSPVKFNSSTPSGFITLQCYKRHKYEKKIRKKMHKLLSSLQSFKIAVCFLEYFYYKTKCDDLGSLLGDMQLFKDGSGTWDPAVWHDWTDALENKTSTTPFEAFQATFNFLNSYHKRISSSSINIQSILNEMKTYKDHKIADSKIWKLWIKYTANIIYLLYFKAMKNFLEKWFSESQCECDSVATLLTSMNLNWRGGQRPFDPALWDDWLESVQAILEKNHK